MLRLALAVLLLVPSLAGAATVSRLPPGWRSALSTYFAAGRPSYKTVEPLVRLLDGLDPHAPQVKAGLAPLYAALREEAAALLAAPVPLEAAESDLASAQNKFRFLNNPAVRDFLAEDQRERVAAAAWAYNGHLWRARGLSLEEKIEGITRALSAPPPVEAALPEPLAVPGAALKVVKGELSQADAEAVLTAIEADGMCAGGVNAALGCVREAVEKAMPLKAGQVVLAKAGKKDFVLVVDDWKRPLSEVVLGGLRAAEKAGHASVALPAMRTGFVFGAVERTYAQVVAGMTQGVRDFLLQSAGTLKKITLVVRNNSQLALAFQKAWHELEGSGLRERSLREDLRQARLSGRGFTMAPKRKRVRSRDKTSPIYATLLKPWDLSHMLQPHAPVNVGKIVDRREFSKPVTSVLNMPVKMPGTEVRVPEELGQFREFLQKVIDHEKAVNPEYDRFYMYLTVDHYEVKKGNTHRRPGVHIDGVQGARYKVKLPPEHLYSASDALGTVFYDQPFDLTKLDPAKQHVHAELERQADESKAVRAQDYEIYFWDSYSAHRADVAEEDLVRTFIRVEFSRKVYDSEGDTVNPLFDYRWERVARPIPKDLDDKPVSE